MPQAYCQVLKIINKIVNSINGKALQTRMFRFICQDIGALQPHLFYHTEVKWLSKRKLLIGVLELRAELLEYSHQAMSDVFELIFDLQFLLKLAFLNYLSI